MTDSNRGTGRTTRQLMNLPFGSLFIVSHAHSYTYTKALAKKLKREDIEIQTLAWVNNQLWRGRWWPDIAMDHELTDNPTELINAQTRQNLMFLSTRERKATDSRWPRMVDGKLTTRIELAKAMGVTKRAIDSALSVNPAASTRAEFVAALVEHKSRPVTRPVRKTSRDWNQPIEPTDRTKPTPP